MYDTLYINYDFDIHCHFLRNTYVNRKTYRKNCVKMLKDIATAKYVFFDEATNVTSHVKFRPETVITQLWHGCGAFKKFGYSTADAIFGASRKDMDKYPFNRGYTNVTVSSPEVIWAYEEAMNYSHESGVVKALGSSRTDIFYNKDFIAKAYETLYSVMPQAKGKKVILYAPTFRGRVAKARTPNVLSPEFMKYVLGNEYVLLMKHHPLVRKRPKIPEVCADFARDVTDEMTIEDLLCVSDICISDYSSLVFEYSLFERPMIFLAHDLEEFFDWRGFYYDYFELTPGPVFKSTTEVIEYIQNIDRLFDKERVRAFREKFMSSCDGHATERIIRYIKRYMLRNKTKTPTMTKAKTKTVLKAPKPTPTKKAKAKNKKITPCKLCSLCGNYGGYINLYYSSESIYLHAFTAATAPSETAVAIWRTSFVRQSPATKTPCVPLSHSSPETM